MDAVADVVGKREWIHGTASQGQSAARDDLRSHVNTADAVYLLFVGSPIVTPGLTMVESG